MHKYIAIPMGLYIEQPQIGEHVIFTTGNPERIYSGEIVKIKDNSWGVKTSDGKIWTPYQSDLIPQGTVLKTIKAKIEIL